MRSFQFMASHRTEFRDAIERREEVLPGVTVAGERVTSGFGQPVVSPPALAGALDPTAFDQAAIFEAVERRVQRSDVKADGPPRAVRNQLADFVAVPTAFFEQGEDEEFGASALQFAFELWRGHIS